VKRAMAPVLRAEGAAPQQQAASGVRP